MKAYISGAITGIEDYMKKFTHAEETLKKDGFEVINPARVNQALPESTTYEQYMQMSFLMLDMADCIYMLNGWEKSHGASMEYGYAYAKDKVLMFQKEGDKNEQQVSNIL